MPEIIIYLAEGRNVDAKRQVVKDITDTVVRNFGVAAENVAIQIVEAPRENKPMGGLLFIDRKSPGPRGPGHRHAVGGGGTTAPAGGVERERSP
ncbi:MAG: tautomerase family protein [Devosia sp.]